MDPRSKKEFVADFDYEFEEKQKTVSITEQGVAKAERFLGIHHLYKAENGHLVNHLIQSLKAESLYKRDVDYAVIDGEVKIIDEFTGRILDGRRWSEGLHQAVEAKEGVKVQEENQTLATITYQNYFRLYEKLSGMTGTALTEATEFMKIYELPVVQIPTNMPMVREDRNDQVYKTKEGKWTAVVKEIADRHANGQPVLVGTISVEVSELLGDRLKKRGIPHTVLNAKPEHAAREAEIVAEAGQPGAVTIATNMAGRGVDIKLGGNAEHLARLELAKQDLDPEDPGLRRASEGDDARARARVEANRERVMAAGGLFICGTERHESRRIDNQLRGRAGRQGDPGESRFFLSAEDDLVRLFAGDRIYKILDRLGSVDEEGNEEPIEAGMLSKQIEKAQKKVEEQNFLIRKRVLEYDDVMNEQRRIIYAYRDEVLEGKEMGRKRAARSRTRSSARSTSTRRATTWRTGISTACSPRSGSSSRSSSARRSRPRDRRPRLPGRAHHPESRWISTTRASQELGEELMGALERFLILQIIDERWREHLYDMDYLREGIHLRGFAQIDPLVAYKNEAFELFGDLMNSVWVDFTRMIFNVQVTVDGENGAAQPPGVRRLPAAPRARAVFPTRAARARWAPARSPRGGRGAGPDGGGYEGEGERRSAPRRRAARHRLRARTGAQRPLLVRVGKKFKRCHGA